MFLRLSKGFTLIELMVTIAVVAIMATIAYPSFEGLIRSSRVTTANNEMVGLANLARSEAIRSSRGGGVCGSSDGSTCDGDWAHGAAAFSDPDGVGTLGSGTILRFVSFKDTLTVTGPDAEVAFDARGRRRAGLDQEIIVRAVTCTEGVTQQRRLLINASGQVRSTKETCS